MSQPSEYINSELPAIQLFQQLGYQYFDASSHDERINFPSGEGCPQGGVAFSVERKC